MIIETEKERKGERHRGIYDIRHREYKKAIVEDGMRV